MANIKVPDDKNNKKKNSVTTTSNNTNSGAAISDKEKAEFYKEALQFYKNQNKAAAGKSSGSSSGSSSSSSSTNSGNKSGGSWVNDNAKDNMFYTALGSIAPGLGIAGLLAKGLGGNWRTFIGRNAENLHNKFKNPKFGGSSSDSVQSTAKKSGGKTEGAVDKAKKGGIFELIQVTKKGFKDVLKKLGGKSVSKEEKKKSGLFGIILGALMWLKSKIAGLFGNLFRMLLGRTLLGRLLGGLGNTITKGLSKILPKSIGSIFKHGLGRALPRSILKMFGPKAGGAMLKVGSRLLPAAGIGLAAGLGTQWVAKKLGANENQARGFGKVAGLGAAGAKIGAAFGPMGALIGAGVGAVAGALWHGASELKRVNQEYKKAGQALKQYTIEEIKAGKAVGDKNVPQVSNGAWSRSLGWLGSRWSKESRENYRKVEAQRVATNEANAKHFANAKYGSIDDLSKDAERIKATLSNTGWFSKSGKAARRAALGSISGTVGDHIINAADPEAAMKEMEAKYGISHSEAKKMRKEAERRKKAEEEKKREEEEKKKAEEEAKARAERLKKTWNQFKDGSLFKKVAHKVKDNATSIISKNKDTVLKAGKTVAEASPLGRLTRWLTKQNKKDQEKNEDTEKNTDALTKLTEILTQITNPDGLESKGQRGNPQQSPIPQQGNQTAIVDASQAPAASPIPLAGITQ